MIKIACPGFRFAAGFLLSLGLPLAALGALRIGPQQEDVHGLTELPMKVSSSIHFREIGPAIAGGRVSAVVGVTGNPAIYYVGAADGGIFRTEDGGMTWKALFQHQLVASIGALAIDPRNPAVIWAGTGESAIRKDVSYGNGIYKSTDSGRHWKHLGLDHTFQISRIAINPLHADTVLVGAMGSPWHANPDRGIYRTTDGGASWQKVLYVGPDVGISDLAMDPQNPNIVFAATYRFRRTPWGYSDGGPEDAIYKSIDGGLTWKRLISHGLPTQPVARIGLAIAASSPNVVYAVMGSNEGALWRSDDDGENWTLVSKDQEVDARSFYFSRLEVDPKDANRVFALSSNLLESTDGGQHFKKIANSVHVDHHAMWIDPAGSGRIMDGNDGGVALSLDNGKHWIFFHSFPIGQYYHVAAGSGPLYEVCGGLQDNASWCGPSRDNNPDGILNRDWFRLNGGDGMYAVPAADNPNLIYNSTQNQSLTVFDRATQQSLSISPYPRDTRGGGVADIPYRFNWDAGFAVSPVNAKVLYAGGNVLFKSEDRGRTWKPVSPDLTRNDKSKQAASGGPVIKDNSGAEVYDTILAITGAPSDPKVIWVGTDDGYVQVTRNGGASWSNVSANIKRLPAWGRVESIDVAANDPGSALIAVDRHLSGDFRPYLYRTSDYGAHWTSISGDLPSEVYAHVVRRDLHNPYLYYAGLENGLYVSWDAGKKWYMLGLGLPDVAVYDLAFDTRDNDLVVATHGRSLWVLDDLTPLQDYGTQVANSPLTLFRPGDALRFWPWAPTLWLGDETFYGQNPTYGASFSYYLSKTVKEPGELVISDSSGKVVRTMKGLHAGPKGENIPWVPGKAGLERIHWDLHADGPVRWRSAPPVSRGPASGALVPPGTYTAALKIGGETASQTFTVVNDPASHASQQDLRDRYQQTEAVLHELSLLDVLLNHLHAIGEQLKALELAVDGSPNEHAVTAAAESLRKASQALEAKITSNPGTAESKLRTPNQVHEQLAMIADMLQGEDDAVTPAILEQKALLAPKYRAAIQAYDDFLTSSVASFNQDMSSRNLPGVVAGPKLMP